MRLLGRWIRQTPTRAALSGQNKGVRAEQDQTANSIENEFWIQKGVVFYFYERETKKSECHTPVLRTKTYIGVLIGREEKDQKEPFKNRQLEI